MLTHLQIVIVNRLRLGESLLVSWIDSVEVGNGRSVIWMTPATPVYFKFSGSRIPAVDPVWLGRLSASATSSTGLVVTDPDGNAVPAGRGGAVHRVPRMSGSRTPG